MVSINASSICALGLTSLSKVSVQGKQARTHGALSGQHAGKLGKACDAGLAHGCQSESQLLHFCYSSMLAKMRKTEKHWGPCTHLRDMEEAAGFFLLPGPALASVAIRGSEPAHGRSASVSPCLYTCDIK